MSRISSGASMPKRAPFAPAGGVARPSAGIVRSALERRRDCRLGQDHAPPRRHLCPGQPAGDGSRFGHPHPDLPGPARLYRRSEPFCAAATARRRSRLGAASAHDDGNKDSGGHSVVFTPSAGPASLSRRSSVQSVALCSAQMARCSVSPACRPSAYWSANLVAGQNRKPDTGTVEKLSATRRANIASTSAPWGPRSARSAA